MLRTLLLRAIQTALHAGYRIMMIYDTDFHIWQKHDKSPLTTAECYAHEIVTKLLRSTQIPVLSEKNKDIPFHTRSTWDVFWLIDPLDGTKEFIKKNGEFTVNIALIMNHEPVLGVIFAPYMNLLYFTDNNKVTYKLEKNFQMAGLLDNDLFDVFACEITAYFSQCKKLPLPQPSNHPYTIVGSRSQDTSELEIYKHEKTASIKNVEYVSIGSSLKFCVVAEGLADEYHRTGPTMEWATAAGHVIAKCARAQVVQPETGLPLLYNKESLKNPNFIVKGIHYQNVKQRLACEESCGF